MTTIEVMRKALEALEADDSKLWPSERRKEAITALRAEIERLEAVEPVAWMHPSGGVLRHPSTGLERETFTIPLYTAPIAPSIPALTDEDVRTELTRQYDEDGGAHFLKLADWAYALAAERAGVQIKDTLQELADDARQIGLEY